jgi:hypothetical protein
MDKGMTMNDEKCTCDHTRENHVLRDGIHGSGFCTYDKAGEAMCQCYSFEKAEAPTPSPIDTTGQEKWPYDDNPAPQEDPLKIMASLYPASIATTQGDETWTICPNCNAGFDPAHKTTLERLREPKPAPIEKIEPMVSAWDLVDAITTGDEKSRFIAAELQQYRQREDRLVKR